MPPRAGKQATFAYLCIAREAIPARWERAHIACTVAMLPHVVTWRGWAREKSGRWPGSSWCPSSGRGRGEGRRPGRRGESECALLSPALVSLYCGLTDRMSFDRVTEDRVGYDGARSFRVCPGVTVWAERDVAMGACCSISAVLLASQLLTRDKRPGLSGGVDGMGGGEEERGVQGGRLVSR